MRYNRIDCINLDNKMDVLKGSDVQVAECWNRNERWGSSYRCSLCWPCHPGGL